jgi:hypothetical protein
MVMDVQATQANLDASWRLLQRMFPGNEKDLPNLIFWTNQPPIPTQFRDAQHPFTQDLVALLNQNMVGIATCATVGEWHLEPAQVDRLDVQDPRITALKQRVLNEIAQMPSVQQLRADRMQIITQRNNATLFN